MSLDTIVIMIVAFSLLVNSVKLKFQINKLTKRVEELEKK